MQTGEQVTAIETEAPKQQYLITRRFNVHITGSLASFNGTCPDAATWQPVQGKAGEIFGVNDVFESQPGANIDEQPKIDGEWYKITRQGMNCLKCIYRVSCM